LLKKAVTAAYAKLLVGCLCCLDHQKQQPAINAVAGKAAIIILLP